MAEPFKNMLNPDLVKGMAFHFKRHYPNFDEAGFIADITQQLETLELKARSELITQMMYRYLPGDFHQSASILKKSLGTPLGENLSEGIVDQHGIAGWAVMPMCDYVALYGQQHFESSMTLFKEMTKRSSSEFGIRYFLREMPDETIAVMQQWTQHKNPHVRRLASEGCRPRLPWGMRLKSFIDNPSPVLQLLEKLKNDKSGYVRRSVANNLNDIAKDHPEKVVDLSKRWLGKATPEQHKLLKHACRTLIKQGHKETLKLFGYTPAQLSNAKLTLTNNEIQLGESLNFTLTLQSSTPHTQALMVDYVIHHQKANGSTTPKVFKWRQLKLSAESTATLQKKHAIKIITTRNYYPGLHKLEIIVNGDSVATETFTLSIRQPNK